MLHGIRAKETLKIELKCIENKVEENTIAENVSEEQIIDNLSSNDDQLEPLDQPELLKVKHQIDMRHIVATMTTIMNRKLQEKLYRDRIKIIGGVL